MKDEVTEIDTQGLLCPLPVLRARKAMGPLPAGSLLRVLASDPDSLQDFQAWCETSGHELLKQEETEEGLLIHLIRKAA